MKSPLSRPARTLLRRVVDAEAHHHLATALLAGIATFAGTFAITQLPVCLAISWNAFALTSLLLAWGGMLIHGAQARVRDANLEDSNRAAIASCIIVAALASLLAAGVLLASAKTLHGGEVIGHVALAAATVMSSWLLVHSLLAVHYTHLYYATDGAGGLDFPNTNRGEPDFIDFAYFSFVIGMTFQVSDVQVTTRGMRRIVLLHSLLSFLFNTVIVAFSINLATTLL